MHEQTGLKGLYDTFVKNQATVLRLRGKNGHEASDLNSIIQEFRGWHLNHCPKLEYYFFLEKVEKMGSKSEIRDYMQKVRKHYKGEEIFAGFDDEPEEPKLESVGSAQPERANQNPQPRPRVRFAEDEENDLEMDNQIQESHPVASPV